MIEFSVMDVFTVQEIDRAGELYAETSPEDFTRRCAAEIVTPALLRIDEATGESNDAMELADKVNLVLRHGARRLRAWPAVTLIL